MDMCSDGIIYHQPMRRSGRMRPLQTLMYSATESSQKYHPRLLKSKRWKLKKFKPLPEPEKKFQGQPASLYGFCMDLVVDNLDICDSLLGLPSLIGEEIFNECMRKKQFSFDHYEHDVIHHRVGLFLEAYGTEMLNSLNMSKKWKFTACYLDQISMLLPYVSTVDFSYCRIGDQHEILGELGKLNEIKQMNLTGNDIGDVGVKNLLQPHRRAKSGLENLEVLLLAENYKLTRTCLAHLRTLPKLKVISLSGDIQDSEGYFTQSCTEGVKHTTNFEITNSKFEWGYDLVKHWLEAFKANESKKQLESRKREETKFYKKSQLRGIGVATKAAKNTGCEKRDFVLCCCGKRRKETQVTLKRKSQVQKSTFAENKHKRRKCDGTSSLPSSEFDDLFKLYAA